MISQEARYASRDLITLAKAGQGEGLLIAETSENAEIPRKFLEHILHDLKCASLVMSGRGKNGGYVLIKHPDETFFGEVLRLMTRSGLVRLHNRAPANCAGVLVEVWAPGAGRATGVAG